MVKLLRGDFAGELDRGSLSGELDRGSPSGEPIPARYPARSP